MLYANISSGTTLSRMKLRTLLEARTERQPVPWGDPGMFCVGATVSYKTYYRLFGYKTSYNFNYCAHKKLNCPAVGPVAQYEES
jgi:hypothetical protein